MTTTPLPIRLRAVTRPVDSAVASEALARLDHDGFAWLHDSTRLVATGVAARVPAGDVDAVLGAADTDDRLQLPGTGPIAVGALPFDPGVSGTLVVPARVFGERDGHAWITEIGPESGMVDRGARPPARFSVVTPRSRAAWDTGVRAALAAIGRGEIEKVVLAREVLVEADEPFDIRGVLRTLERQQPGCFVFASDGLVGASPELLVRRVGPDVESRPMAGTAAADGDEALRALARSAKDNREHRFVVDAITTALAPVCSGIEVGMIPDVVVFGPVAHLVTPVRGQLEAPAPSALSLARLLSPTPAVGGTPRGEALAKIAELEGFDRGRYAGPVGWVDARGDGEFAIALRCAELDGSRARLVAGAGIVDGSDPAAEWAETQVKLEPMLRALVRP